MTKETLKIPAILLTQVLVYLTCTQYFGWYLVVIALSLVGLVYIFKQKPEPAARRLLELAIVETFFVCLLYGVWFFGHGTTVAYLILFLIFLPQGMLFILASYQGKRYVKSFNTFLHLLLLIYLGVQGSTSDMDYPGFPLIFGEEANAFYELMYLAWVIPFLVSGARYYSMGFILIQVFSLVLAFLHEDFLSMRLFTAQISFVMILLFKMNFEITNTRYLKEVNNGLSVLSTIGILTISALYFF